MPARRLSMRKIREVLRLKFIPSRNHKSGSAQGGHTGFRLDA